MNKSFLILAIIITSVCAVAAQTTAFSYQGRLTDAGNAANGSYGADAICSRGLSVTYSQIDTRYLKLRENLRRFADNQRCEW